jgi:uncharacterized circularly permuted ATP-grasp superfamily protein
MSLSHGERVSDLFRNYRRGDHLDEALEADLTPRPAYARLIEVLEAMGIDELGNRAELCDKLQRSRGATFTVYADGRQEERPLPLDLIPRLLAPDEWAIIESGVRQRVKALNAFLDDVYSHQAIMHDRIVPAWVVLGSPGYQRACWGVTPPGHVRVHVSGLDVIRDDHGTWKVLEDNVRVPSGVSYLMENREIMARVLPELFDAVAIQPVDHYATLLLDALRYAAPPQAGHSPNVVLLTPGSANSAYFEHALLARQMGIELVEGGDLVVESDGVYVRTTAGPRRVDVIYRRVDEDYLDPLAFRSDSLLGCAGLVNAARSGLVSIANALGNGVADDKAVYTYVPQMIRYYLGEEPVLGNVDTYLCGDDAHREIVLARLDQLVVKPVDGSGGYGMVFGPLASDLELEELRVAIEARPSAYIAQEIVSLSQHPTRVEDGLAPRRVDLRPFAVYGDDVRVLPGGLTRVALPEGSLVVNSSQGGGSKDTWVVRDAGVVRESWVGVGESRSTSVAPPRLAGPGLAQDYSGQPQQQHQQLTLAGEEPAC